MTTTETAMTPEELARTADLRASLDRAYAIASPTGAANHLAAWANNHGKALLDLAEAQRSEIKRLTVVNNAYVDLVGELIEATGTDNIADAVKAAVAAVEAAQ